MAVLFFGLSGNGRDSELRAAIQDDQPDRPVIRAVRATTSILVDGRLDEAAWLEAPVAKGFTQREPRPGLEATEATEFRVLFSEEGIYFGLQLKDRAPGMLVREQYGRDVGALRGRNDYWSADDAVSLLLDTFHDHRNAYYFSVNPNGARTDALITSEGNGRNFDWDGVWEAAAWVHEDGWSVEIFIPWNTLRFPSVREPVLGLNVQRNIRRKTEETYWASIDLNQDLWRISRAGHLEGVVLPDRTRPLEIKPFGVANWRDGEATRNARIDVRPGFDAKIGISDGLTTDLTYRTDFAQVEADEQLVNLDRFPLAFPEKREFFLENAGLFEVGVDNITQLFFSRRIGLDASGLPVPIRFGGRLSGRVGRYEIGLLDIQTDAAATTPAANHLVARLRRDILSRSNVGVLVSNFDAGSEGTYNRLAAVDLDLNPWRHLGFNGFLARSFSPGSDGDGLGIGGVLHWATDALGIRIVANDYQEQFRPALGFLPRGSVHHYQPGARYSFRPEWGTVRRVVFRSTSDFIYDREWAMVSRTSMAQGIVTLESADEVTIQVTNRFERLDQPFQIHPDVEIVEGKYGFTTQFLRVVASNRRPISGSARLDWGRYYSGEWRTLELRGSVKLTSHLLLAPRYGRNQVALPTGAFITNLAGLQIGVAPSNRLTLDGFLQYNDAVDRFSTNLRLVFNHSPGGHFYLVYNETRDLMGMDWPIEDRQLIAKVTYLWRR